MIALLTNGVTEAKIVGRMYKKCRENTMKLIVIIWSRSFLVYSKYAYNND